MFSTGCRERRWRLTSTNPPKITIANATIMKGAAWPMVLSGELAGMRPSSEMIWAKKFQVP